MPVLAPNETTSVATVIQRIRDHYLYGTYRATLNQLAVDPGSGGTTLTFTYDMEGITRGSYLSIEQEVVYVWATNPASKTATVARAQMGTLAAAHAIATTVEINPRFPRPMIKQTMEEEIRSWPTSLFKVDALDISATTSFRAYDLTGIGDFYFVVEVRKSQPSGDTTRSWPKISFDVIRDMSAANFASGSAIQLQSPLDTARTLRVTYARPFDVSVFEEATDLVATCGLSSSMVDIVQYGTAWRLLQPREIQRTSRQSQGEPRKAEEVPPGFTSATAAGLKKLRDNRIDEESNRLRAKYPYRVG